MFFLSYHFLVKGFWRKDDHSAWIIIEGRSNLCLVYMQKCSTLMIRFSAWDANLHLVAERRLLERRRLLETGHLLPFCDINIGMSTITTENCKATTVMIRVRVVRIAFVCPFQVEIF